eukprot:CAMPEP_0197540324 /NCGR_PEP_ID=MMETSP1318-20131121/65433_1 /TAXON_ID=552666 /ORGANISM="Partenskyella glossopodia, Strain RCC365" /LENGTH=154 /DNA_ID=CAMNT_0043099273 /DNA_START=84 /DNA_END=545 /DNA_ORIENTATION=+
MAKLKKLRSPTSPTSPTSPKDWEAKQKADTDRFTLSHLKTLSHSLFGFNEALNDMKWAVSVSEVLEGESVDEKKAEKLGPMIQSKIRKQTRIAIADTLQLISAIYRCLRLWRIELEERQHTLIQTVSMRLRTVKKLLYVAVEHADEAIPHVNIW